MAMDDTESCNSRAVDSWQTLNPKQQRYKLEVFSEVLHRLKESDNEEVHTPSFEDDLWNHFNRLPARYALDVNVERAEDVLNHKRLLHLAKDPAKRPVFDVRLVQVPPANDGRAGSMPPSSSGKEDDQTSGGYTRKGIHPPPAFGSSPNLEALALEGSRSNAREDESTINGNCLFPRAMHEVTFSTNDKPKLLSQLTALLAEIGLNIQEAHAFSTTDGYSLDVFVVDGWKHEETEHLRAAIRNEIAKTEKQAWSKPQFLPIFTEQVKTDVDPAGDHVKIPTDGTDVWEIDLKLLKFESKVASGSYGDLYRGSYCSQDVAIKVLKPERIDADMQREFAQEVYIMRIDGQQFDPEARLPSL